MSGAARRLCQGPALSAHVLQTVSAGHRRFPQRTQMPRVPDSGWRGRGAASKQHPAGQTAGWHQAEALETRPCGGQWHQLHQRLEGSEQRCAQRSTLPPGWTAASGASLEPPGEGE